MRLCTLLLYISAFNLVRCCRCNFIGCYTSHNHTDMVYCIGTVHMLKLEALKSK